MKIFKVLAVMLMAVAMMSGKAKVATVAPAVNLTWGQPTVGCTGSNTCSYNILRGPTSGSETSLATGVTTLTYQDLAVTRGNSYCYEISATNSIGTSPVSNEVCLSVPTVPSAPTGLTAVAQ